MKRLLWISLAVLASALLLLWLLIWHFASDADETRHFPPGQTSQTSQTSHTVSAAQIERGAYLARAGDCIACHTQRGGQAYAGGRVLATPFGEIVAPNITPDKATGLGQWQADDFWRALHHGKSRDGRMLYPAFPYPNYTNVSREDADALFAFLQSLPAVANVREPHRLRFPYNQPFMLAAWRALYFRPGSYQTNPAHDAVWNRGAYLVQGLGHCNACHTSRNWAGASQSATDLAGGLIPVLDWYAPALTSEQELGLGSWPQAEVAALLHTGVSNKSAVFGPMAEVVRQSLQHLSTDDINAIAHYLKALPASAPPEPEPNDNVSKTEREQILAQGAKLYETHCQDCHMADGKGKGNYWPPLAGNRAITMPQPINSIRMVLNGGFAPATHGNPRPYGMPPYGPLLTDAEVAAVVSYIRQAWGNAGSGRALVDPSEVNRNRSVPLD
jgi:mono/diheme cytochrome c family protein